MTETTKMSSFADDEETPAQRRVEDLQRYILIKKFNKAGSLVAESFKIKYAARF